MVDPNRQFDNPDFDAPEVEHDLRQALQPRSAPQGFAARLMQQIPPESPSWESPRVPHPSSAWVGRQGSPSSPNPRLARIFAFPPALHLAAVAATLVVIFIGTFTWQQHQQRIAGERASQQVILALQITHATLQQVADNVSSIQNRGIQNRKELQP